MQPKKFAFAVFLFALNANCLISETAPKRNITETDLFAFNWIGDTELSPNGTQAVFVQTTVNTKREGYDTALYLLDLKTPNSTPRRLTNGPHDSEPRWSPDGKQIAFVRAIEKDGKPQPPQIYLLPLDGGDPMQLSSLEKGASSPHWSPDGQSIAVICKTPIHPDPAKPDAPKDDKHVSDVLIISKAVYRSNGAGYLDTKTASQLYLCRLPKSGEAVPKPQTLTTGEFGVSDYVWDVKGQSILYTSEHVEEPYYTLPHNEIYRVDIPVSGDAQASQLVVALTFSAFDLALSPDGTRVAFHAEDQPRPPRSHQQSDLFILPLGSPKPTNLTSNYDYEIGSGVGGDNTAPRGGGHSAPVWSTDGSVIIDVVGKQGSALLVEVNAASGAVKELTEPKQAVIGFSLAGSQLLALISTPINIGDLFTIALDGSKRQEQRTGVNEALFSQLNLTMPESVQVTPTARPQDIPGSTIESFVQRPPDFNPNSKYPLILNIHGGPHAAYGWVFDHEMQWMAAKGYIVVYPNPRGSTTYGQVFANVIQHNYPGDDFHDLMDCVDAVIKTGSIDSDKLGVTGGSGGGLLTDWTVTQTKRFKAAVAQRDITDWANWWYTADFTLFQKTWFEGAPFEQPEEFKKHSPISYIKNVETPMMFILGDADYRTPPTAGGEDFFRALKYRHIDTVMLRFPGESHELSRSGQPWHRIERLQNIVNWFDKYLMDKPEPQYASQ